MGRREITIRSALLVQSMYWCATALTATDMLTGLMLSKKHRWAIPCSTPKFARTIRLLQHRDPASPPHPGATGVASQLRGVGGAQSSAMAGEVRGAKRQSGVLDEGDAFGLGGAGQSQPANKREEFGHHLGPPAEVRVPAAPLRANPLIRKRLVPAVNAVEGRCYGNDREGDETMPPGQDENAEKKSAESVDVDAKVCVGYG